MIDPVAHFLARAEPYGLRPAGAGKWRARGFCHGGNDPTSLSIGVGDDGRVLLHCHAGCAPADIAGAVGLTMADLFASSTMPCTTAPMPAQYVASVVQHQHATLSNEWRVIWDAACLITEAGAGPDYLTARGCVLPPADGDLRWHRALRHPTGHTGPALLALITDIATRVPISLHFTWVNADGTKADCKPPRRLLAGHRKAGGVVRLWPDESVTLGLGVAEGIETALSLAHAFAPVWALIDAGNLSAMPVLEGIESLTIAADHDAAGIAAAEKCGQRWADAGREVYVAMPDQFKRDLNDVARCAE
jgi:hypothetical protein